MILRLIILLGHLIYVQSANIIHVPDVPGYVSQSPWNDDNLLYAHLDYDGQYFTQLKLFDVVYVGDEQGSLISYYVSGIHIHETENPSDASHGGNILFKGGERVTDLMTRYSTSPNTVILFTCYVNEQGVLTGRWFIELVPTDSNTIQ